MNSRAEVGMGLAEDINDFSSAEEKFLHRQLDLKVPPAVARQLTYVCRRRRIPPDEIEDRALYSLRELPEAAGLRIVEGFGEVEFTRLGNKTALLSSMAKAQRQSASSALTTDDPRIQALLEHSGYRLDVTGGQRKYWHPALTRNARPGCEVFVSRIPRNVFEDELIPFFEEYGTVCEFRMMMDATTGNSRGFGFLCFMTEEAANKCTELCPLRELHGRLLSVSRSRANSRLMVRGIPGSLDKQQIFDELHQYLDGVKDVVLRPTSDRAEHCSVYVDFDDHRLAGIARHKLMSGRVLVFKGNTITCDWANASNEDDETVTKLSASQAGGKQHSDSVPAPKAKRPYLTPGINPHQLAGPVRLLHPQQMKELAEQFDLRPLVLEQLMAKVSWMLDRTPAADRLQQVLQQTMEQNKWLEEQISELHRINHQLKDQVERLTQENKAFRCAYRGYTNHTSGQEVYDPSDSLHTSLRTAYGPRSQTQEPSEHAYRNSDRSTAALACSDQQGQYQSSSYSTHAPAQSSADGQSVQQYSGLYSNSTHQAQTALSSTTFSSAQPSSVYNTGQYPTLSTVHPSAAISQYATAYYDQLSGYAAHAQQSTTQTYRQQRQPYLANVS